MADGPSSPTPHDALFKWTFSQVEHAVGELRHVLPPALVAEMDLGSLAVCKGSFVDERLIGRHSDVLYSVELADRDALVYVLFEHQSSVDRMMPLRVLGYMVRIWEWYLTKHPTAARLPPIVPVVIHHSATGWQASTSFHALLDVDLDEHPEVTPLVPGFEFLLDDVSFQSDSQLRGRAMTALARIVLWCLRDARTPDTLVDHLARWMDVLQEVTSAPRGLEALERVLRYTVDVAGQQSLERLEEVVMQQVDEDQRQPYITIADRLVRRGMKAERRALVSKQLMLRFGELSEEVRARIEAADPDTLSLWAERLVTAGTLDEILND